MIKHLNKIQKSFKNCKLSIATYCVLVSLLFGCNKNKALRDVYSASITYQPEIEILSLNVSNLTEKEIQFSLTVSSNQLILSNNNFYFRVKPGAFENMRINYSNDLGKEAKISFLINWQFHRSEFPGKAGDVYLGIDSFDLMIKSRTSGRVYSKKIRYEKNVLNKMDRNHYSKYNGMGELKE